MLGLRRARTRAREVRCRSPLLNLRVVVTPLLDFFRLIFAASPAVEKQDLHPSDQARLQLASSRLESLQKDLKDRVLLEKAGELALAGRDAGAEQGQEGEPAARKGHALDRVAASRPRLGRLLLFLRFARLGWRLQAPGF